VVIGVRVIHKDSHIYTKVGGWDFLMEEEGWNICPEGGLFDFFVVVVFEVFLVSVYEACYVDGFGSRGVCDEGFAVEDFCGLLEDF